MTTDTCADIASYLIAQGVGCTLSTYLTAGTGTPISYGYLPPAPIRCIAIFAIGGLDPVATHNIAESDLQKPGIQVMVRSDDYDDATSKLRAAYTALNRKTELLINGTRYLSIFPELGYNSLGWYDDGAGWALKIVQNYRLLRSG